MAPDAWQRLAPAALLFLFLRGLGRFLRENLPVLAGAGAGAALLDAVGIREVVLVTLALLGGGLLLALVYFRRFRYRLDGNVLRVQKGLLEQSELKVRSEQIQQVQIEQPWHLRLFGLVRFSVDTAGGAATEVELPGITRSAADVLREALEQTHAAATAAPADTEPPALHRATPMALALHGLASNYAWFALAALAPILNRLERIVRARWEDFVLPAPLAALLERPVLGATALLATLLVGLMATSIVITLLRYWNFRLYRMPAGAAPAVRFRQTGGLVSRRELLLVAHRLQVVETVQSVVGRLLGRCHLVCRQIGGMHSDQDITGQVFLIPGLDAADASRLLPHFWPGVDPAPAFRRVSPYYRRVLWLRLAVLMTAGAGLLAWQQHDPLWLLVGIIGIPALHPVAHLRWQSHGWHEQGAYLQIRRGLIGRRTLIFPRHNVQRISLQQNWFQRRRGVASLVLTLASGPATVVHLPVATAWRLLDETVASIEGHDARIGEGQAVRGS